MREIKFRAFDKKTKIMHTVENHGLKWIAVYETDPKYQGNCYSHISGWFLGEIMQFTGLKDKNKKRIFEDDIFEIDGRIYKVGWFYEGARFCLYRYFQGCWQLSDYDISGEREIIGNIYENPELLERMQ